MSVFGATQYAPLVVLATQEEEEEDYQWLTLDNHISEANDESHSLLDSIVLVIYRSKTTAHGLTLLSLHRRISTNNSLYMTNNYYFSIVTMCIPCFVSKLQPDIGQLQGFFILKQLHLAMLFNIKHTRIWPRV